MFKFVKPKKIEIILTKIQEFKYSTYYSSKTLLYYKLPMLVY
jgi:hypothetical protein